MRPTKSFDWTTSREKQCAEFISDWNEINDNCQLDQFDEIENEPKLRVAQISEQIKTLQYELAEITKL